MKDCGRRGKLTRGTESVLIGAVRGCVDAQPLPDFAVQIGTSYLPGARKFYQSLSVMPARNSRAYASVCHDWARVGKPVTNGAISQRVEWGEKSALEIWHQLKNRLSADSATQARQEFGPVLRFGSQGGAVHSARSRHNKNGGTKMTEAKCPYCKLAKPESEETCGHEICIEAHNDWMMWEEYSGGDQLREARGCLNALLITATAVFIGFLLWEFSIALYNHANQPEHEQVCRDQFGRVVECPINQ